MTEAYKGKTFSDYERVSTEANNLYKQAERLVGTRQEELAIQMIGVCALMERRAFYLADSTNVGNLIRDAHARYAIQNFYRAGRYSDVRRFGTIALGVIKEEESAGTIAQIEGYVKAAINILGNST